MHKKIGFIPIITILRGIAALMVCLFHFVCKTTGYFTNEYVLKVFDIGGLGVSMFFVISGVVLPLSMLNGNYKFTSWKKFLVKRIIRIEPPYIMAIILATLYMFLRSYMPNSTDVDLRPGFMDIILHIGYLVPFFENVKWLNGAFWTLAIEFQYYLTLILLFPLMVNKKIWNRVLFYLVFLLPTFFMVLPSFLIHWASLFLLGILYILNKTEKIKKMEYYIVSTVSAFSVYYFLGIDSLIIAISTLLIIHFFPNYKQNQLKFLGNISYSLYLVHGITGAALINILSHSFNEPYQKPLVIVIGLFFSIFCAYLMYLFIEKPSQKIAASIVYDDVEVEQVKNRFISEEK